MESFKQRILEAKPRKSTLEGFKGKFNQKEFQKIIDPSIPEEPVDTKDYYFFEVSIHTGTYSIIVGYQETRYAPTAKELRISSNGIMTFRLWDNKKEKWVTIFDGVELNVQTWKSDIKTLGGFYKKLSGKDPTKELITWIEKNVTFSGNLKNKLIKEEHKLLSKVLKELNALDDFYLDNRETIMKVFKYDPNKTNRYVIQQFRSQIKKYTLDIPV